jgi:hypothetical protein
MVSNSVGTVFSPAAWLKVSPCYHDTTAGPDWNHRRTGDLQRGLREYASVELSVAIRGCRSPGRNQPILDLTNLTADQAGSYSVVISNSEGVFTSSNAVLTTVPLVNTHAGPALRSGTLSAWL